MQSIAENKTKQHISSVEGGGVGAPLFEVGPPIVYIIISTTEGTDE